MTTATHTNVTLSESEIATILKYVGAQPCCCYACDSGVQPGHFACSQPPAVLLQLEAQGRVIRYYNGTSWVWDTPEELVE
jgi:hypothetical protein